MRQRLGGLWAKAGVAFNAVHASGVLTRQCQVGLRRLWLAWRSCVRGEHALRCERRLPSRRWARADAIGQGCLASVARPARGREPCASMARLILGPGALCFFSSSHLRARSLLRIWLVPSPGPEPLCTHGSSLPRARSRIDSIGPGPGAVSTPLAKPALAGP